MEHLELCEGLGVVRLLLLLLGLGIFESRGPSEICDFNSCVFIDEEVFHLEVSVANLSSFVEEGDAVENLLEDEPGVGLGKARARFEKAKELAIFCKPSD